MPTLLKKELTFHIHHHNQFAWKEFFYQRVIQQGLEIHGIFEILQI
jgi:hypothetical protein